MSLTRRAVESILLRRIGKTFDAVGLDGQTVGGNSDLSDPIAWAIRQLGGSVADPVDVSDADVATAEGEGVDALLDYAELRALQTAVQACDLVDISVGPRRESLGQLRDGINTAIARKAKDIEAAYGGGLPVALTGVVTSNFQQTGETSDL